MVGVILIEAFGGLSGWLSNSGYGNPWFDFAAQAELHAARLALRRRVADPVRALGIALGDDSSEPPSDQRRLRSLCSSRSWC